MKNLVTGIAPLPYRAKNSLDILASCPVSALERVGFCGLDGSGKFTIEAMVQHVLEQVIHTYHGLIAPFADQTAGHP